MVSLRDGCFNRVTVPQLPLEFAMLVALRVAGQPEDFTEDADRTIRAKLLGAGMEELLDLEFEVPTEQPSSLHPAGWEMQMTVPLIVKLELEQEGAHSLDFYVDGKLQADRSVSWWVALATEETNDADAE
jgi:hypothetical protein